MFKPRALLALDFYKTGHVFQYPEGTEAVYSNWTARSGSHSLTGLNGVVWFGLQAFIKAFLQECWEQTFFDRPKDEVLAEYKRRMDTSLGPGAVPMDHIAWLHDLGYLPLLIKALPEGVLVPYGVPLMTMVNTGAEGFWLTNYLESVMSTELWLPTTSATTAYAYRQRFNEHSARTGSDPGFIQWQGHDFSFRGMGGIAAAAASGAGHLLSFTGTDTVPALDWLEDYYNADCENELIGGSVPATEHSVMSMGLPDKEFETFKRLITEVYPTGIVSIVSDTFDLWRVVREFLPRLKEEILQRDGRVVIRPDSSPKSPVEIMCGDPEASERHLQEGLYNLLYELFPGEDTALGYKTLDPHIGAIYGDSITLERQDLILSRLEAMGYAGQNMVLGIGSFTYTYTTRDTHGFAMKATWGKVNGEDRPIYKDPVTDPGFKRSAVGLVRVVEAPDNVRFRLHDMVTRQEEQTGSLVPVFLDGQLLIDDSLSNIRRRLGTFQ